jgi:DNA-binding MarR family transcriptional regulator
LIKYADKQRTCYPSQDTLALKAGLSRGTVNRALAALEERQIIARKPRYQDGRRLPNLILLKAPMFGG